MGFAASGAEGITIGSGSLLGFGSGGSFSIWLFVLIFIFSISIGSGSGQKEVISPPAASPVRWA